MRVSKSQYEYFIRKSEVIGTLMTEHFRHKKFGCLVRRHIRVGSNEVIAASIDGKRFYVMAERTMGVLTDGLKRTLDYIGKFKRRTNRAPTMPQIAKALKTTGDVIRMNVKRLQDGGYLTKKKRVVGSIEMIPQECPVCHKKTGWPYDHECGV